jgi:hypothetical protein
MDTDEWYDLCSELIDGTIQSIDDETRKVTGADIGLILNIAEDYLDKPEENISRDIRALEFTKAILDAKYNIEDLSWFDLYEVVVELNSDVDCRHNTADNSNIDYKLEDIYDLENAKSSHTREFQKSAQKLFEAVSSNKADRLQEESPYDDLETADFNHLKQSLRTKSGFSYGSVEIPNNASRMKVATNLTEYIKDLDEDDFRWIITTMREWIQMYARAEATVANRNMTQDDLREFMIEEETPAEKYW